MEQKEQDCLYVGRVEISGGRLNVRSAPGGSVIGQLEKGDEVRVLCDGGEWMEIAHDGVSGYAAKRYICFAQAAQKVRLMMEDEAGNTYAPEGGFTLRVVSGPID